MKIIRKIATLALASGCLFFGAGTMASHTLNQSKSSTAVKNAPVKLLFVIQAAHGQLTHVNGREYKLMIPLKDIKSVLAFSDRPYRMAFRMKPAAYAKLIHSGSDSFNKIPPNMVVTIAGSKTIAFTVKNYSATNGTAVYKLQALLRMKPVKSLAGVTVLYLDGTTASTGKTCLSECIATVEAACTGSSEVPKTCAAAKKAGVTCIDGC